MGDWTRTLAVAVLLGGLAVAAGCTGAQGSDCDPGALGCECAGEVCLTGLVCVAPGVCQFPGGSTNTAGGTDSTTDSGGSGGTDSGGVGLGACANYLACLGEVAPDTLANNEAIYGEGGSCWTLLDPAQCRADCRTAMDSFRSSHPLTEACWECANTGDCGNEVFPETACHPNRHECTNDLFCGDGILTEPEECESDGTYCSKCELSSVDYACHPGVAWSTCDYSGQGCLISGGFMDYWQFNCVGTNTFGTTAAGEPCVGYDECQEHHYCVKASALPSCAGSACCTPLCSMLPGGLECDVGETCVPVGESEGSAQPAGLEDLGFCRPS